MNQPKGWRIIMYGIAYAWWGHVQTCDRLVPIQFVSYLPAPCNADRCTRLSQMGTKVRVNDRRSRKLHRETAQYLNIQYYTEISFVFGNYQIRRRSNGDCRRLKPIHEDPHDPMTYANSRLYQRRIKFCEGKAFVLGLLSFATHLETLGWGSSHSMLNLTFDPWKDIIICVYLWLRRSIFNQKNTLVTCSSYYRHPQYEHDLSLT